MEGAMLVRISSQISPNSTRFGVNKELSAKDTRRVNNLGKNNVIYSGSRSVIIKYEDTTKETVYLCLKLIVEEETLKNTVETLSVAVQEEKDLKKKKKLTPLKLK